MRTVRVLIVATLVLGSSTSMARVVYRPRPAPLRVHEWGVWKIQGGRIEHLDDLRRESPPFVRQAFALGWAPGGQLSRKPVLYVYTDRPTDVTVSVRFTGGRPWLYFPGVVNLRPRPLPPPPDTRPVPSPSRRNPIDREMRDRAMPVPAIDSLSWRVRAEPRLTTDGLPPVAPDHFWNHLRDVPAATLVAPDGTRERFIFYDGPVAFPEAFTSRREPGRMVVERRGRAGASDLVVALGDRWVPVRGLRPGLAARIRTVGAWPRPPRPLPDEIRRRLLEAGLSGAEARSLVETWRPEIEDPALRAFWLLPRADYDALLPLEITPAPAEVVRVGLVIERLGPGDGVPRALLRPLIQARR